MATSTLQEHRSSTEAVVNTGAAGLASTNASDASSRNEQMTQGSSEFGTAEVYTIEKGDSLWAIAHRFNVPGGYKFLAEYNNISPSSVIHAGQTLNIPAKGANVAPSNPEPAHEQPAPEATKPAEDSKPKQGVQNDEKSGSAAGEVTGLPTQSPLEQLLAEHPEIKTNQQLINYFYNQAGKDYGKACDLASQSYSVNMNDLSSNRKGTVDTTNAKALFASKNAIFSYLVSNLGFSNAAACGVLGNIHSESGFNTACVGDNGTSYGLCQWHNERKTNLINFCSKNGYELNSVEGQLAYLATELQASYATLLNQLKTTPNTADGAYTAAYSWCCDFEKPKQMESKGKERGKVAKSYFETYGNVTIGAPAKEEKKETPAEDVKTDESTTDTPAVQPPPLAADEKKKDKAEEKIEDKVEEKAEEKKDEAASDDAASNDGYVETTDDNVNKIQKAHPNGITVSLCSTTDTVSFKSATALKDEYDVKGYTTKTKKDKNGNTVRDEDDYKNNAEFEKCATAGAKETDSVNSSLAMGLPIRANAQSSAEKVVNKIYKDLSDKYKAAKPASAKDAPEHLKIKNLSLYYHGGQNSLRFPAGSLSKTGVSSFVSTIKDSLKSDVHVQLYACNTAGKDTGFAHELATELGGDARVYGHNNAAPTTENSSAKYFNGDGTSVNMFDALMPETWIKQEATRIWGADYKDNAYNKLIEKLKLYYNSVCGCTGGSLNKYRKDFQNCTPDYPRWYADTNKWSAMGRHMFYDTEDAASKLQAGWRHWALNDATEKTALAQLGTLANTFYNIDATESEEPAPAQTEAPAGN